jgi:hypothetical protein
VLEVSGPWDGKPYAEYVSDKYGHLGDWPDSIETDWDSELAGSAQGGRGRVVVVSTGKSDWDRDHYVSLAEQLNAYLQDDKSILSHHLNKHISSLPTPKVPENASQLPYIANRVDSLLPSIYSSSLISQSTDPSDETVLVFPDWRVVHEVENSKAGAKELWDGSIGWTAGRAGNLSEHPDTVGRRRSWTMPYRAIVLLCESA